MLLHLLLLPLDLFQLRSRNKKRRGQAVSKAFSFPFSGCPHFCPLILEPDLNDAHAEAGFLRQMFPDLEQGRKEKGAKLLHHTSREICAKREKGCLTYFPTWLRTAFERLFEGSPLCCCENGSRPFRSSASVLSLGSVSGRGRGHWSGHWVRAGDWTVLTVCRNNRIFTCRYVRIRR